MLRCNSQQRLATRGEERGTSLAQSRGRNVRTTKAPIVRAIRLILVLALVPRITYRWH
jgi:hypothetical protein